MKSWKNQVRLFIVREKVPRLNVELVLEFFRSAADLLESSGRFSADDLPDSNIFKNVL